MAPAALAFAQEGPDELAVSLSGDWKRADNPPEASAVEDRLASSLEVDLEAAIGLPDRMTARDGVPPAEPQEEALVAAVRDLAAREAGQGHRRLWPHRVRDVLRVDVVIRKEDPARRVICRGRLVVPGGRRRRRHSESAAEQPAGN
jgi:hypothetical protein